MDKQEAIENFLSTFRVALTNSSVFFKEHPIFIKSLQDLKKSLDQLFIFLNPVKLSIAPNFVMIDEKTYDKSKIYEELAAVFHRRKIKNIIILDGVTIDEICLLLVNASLPARELIRQGSLKKMLTKAASSHIDIEELDYSQLLTLQEGQDKGIWVYLLEEAIEEDNQLNINEFINKFEHIIKSINPKNFLTDQELKNSMKKFLDYLKIKEEDEFKKCSKEILKAIIKEKNISKEQDIQEMNVFIKDLSESDLGDILWEEISSDASFDTVSFNLFFKLIEEKKHDKIRNFLIEKHNNRLVKVTPEVKKRIKELFSVPNDSRYGEVYKHAFDFLLKDVQFEQEGFSFNRQNILVNYRYALLNLLYYENKRENIRFIQEKIYKEWQQILNDGDFEFFKNLLDLCDEEINKFPELKDIFQETERRITNIIEDIAFFGQIELNADYLIDRLRVSTYNSTFYLNKIFNDNKNNFLILKLFFKFFAEDLVLFCEKLKDKSSNIEFTVTIIDSLKRIDLPVAGDTLKIIYSFSNNFVRVEILKAMQKLTNFDKDFVLSVLQDRDLFLKKQAISSLKAQQKIDTDVFDVLFNISARFGRKNKLIIENMSLADEFNLREASPYFKNFVKKRFFWNRNLRNKAKQILKKWQM